MKKLLGKVVSVKMKNTIVIETESFTRHKIYGKIIKSTKKFKADTNGIEVKEGDKVTIISSKPISKDKNWILEKVN